jgi:hypothetical protein
MPAHASNIRWRFGIAVSCAVAALVLYLPTEARATAFHDFYNHFIHPWEDRSARVIILALCAASTVTAIPVLQRGSALQRIGVAVALIAPLFIIGRFLYWVVHQWTT